jgi:hypothetical protein
MKPDDRDPEIHTDPELARLLEEWAVPGVPDTLDRRVHASYRAHIGRVPFWKRFLTTSIRIPLPVALAALLLLALTFWNARRPVSPASPVESAESTLSARMADLRRAPAALRPSLAGFEPVREMNVTVLPQDSVSP